jgi:hypothetical protein
MQQGVLLRTIQTMVACLRSLTSLFSFCELVVVCCVLCVGGDAWHQVLLMQLWFELTGTQKVLRRLLCRAQAATTGFEFRCGCFLHMAHAAAN